MFGRRFNLNIDELMARYNKMMEDFDKNMSSLNKDDWINESYESVTGKNILKALRGFITRAKEEADKFKQ